MKPIAPLLCSESKLHAEKLRTLNNQGGGNGRNGTEWF